MKNISTNTVTSLLLLAITLIVIEGFIFGNAMAIFALVGVYIVYLAIKKQRKQLFWVGVIMLFIALLSMWSLRLLLILTLVYILWKMKQGSPVQININNFQKNSEGSKTNKLIVFDDPQSDTYTWQDVHVQNFVGEAAVDTTSTILPKGTSFISIRQVFGKIVITVPYEVPVRIHYNTMVGEAKIMGESYSRLWNDRIALRDGYVDGQLPERELVIIASSFFGDLEVTRK
ncbi:cell wall-active antibiotics response protein LiaF [Kurthia sibirica]|nr:cell wall-active antibiotics response protein LiaF [Kurthia sibirica]GEK32837.1 hypothetical protein KSI01_03700 [Kurthia sibirica]